MTLRRQWNWLFCTALLASGAVCRGQTTATDVLRSLLDEQAAREGLCLHIGCGDGRTTASLAMNGRYSVHGIDPSAATVAEARRRIEAMALYGPVAVGVSPVGILPYADNVANVIVVDRAEELKRSGLIPSELARVLAPYGVALFAPSGAYDGKQLTAAGLAVLTGVDAEGWTIVKKAYPADMDDWPQWRHDGSRAAVSSDRLVGPIGGLRWLAGERWVPERYGGSGGLTGMFSAGGRVFYIYRLSAQDRHTLVVRDAFNGTLLWEKVLDVPLSQPTPFAADGARVYTVLTAGDPVVALDAATGEVVTTYSFAARMLTLHHGRLIVGPGKHTCYDAETGAQLWQSPVGAYVHCAVTDAGVFVKGYGRLPQNPGKLYRLSLDTGEILWEAVNRDFAELMFCRDGILLTAVPPRYAQGHDPRDAANHAYDAETGEWLWTHRYQVHWHQGRPDAFLVDGKVWIQEEGPPQAWVARDPRSGKEVAKVPLRGARGFQRCYPDLATEQFIFEDVGIGFFDFRRKTFSAFYGGRGTCGGGYRPANGLIYKTPDICVCFSELRGEAAFCGGSVRGEPAAPESGDESRLERGPAYGTIDDGDTTVTTAGEWPTFRHDAGRSGSGESRLPDRLSLRWSTQLAGRISSSVIAGGRVHVAEIDAHRVAVFDAVTGHHAWRFTAGGRIDTPPTVSGTAAVFGSADGYVYCLRASDGRLAWRFRAASEDRWIPADGQVESAWPVHGSVVVAGGTVYCAAGRQSELDGGIAVYALRVADGETVWRTRVARADRLQQASVQDIANTCGRILSSDGVSLYMDRTILDMESGREREQPTGAFLYGGACGFDYDIARPPYGWKHEWRRWVFGTKRPRGKYLGDGHAVGNCIASSADRAVTINSEAATLSCILLKGSPVQEWSIPIAHHEENVRMKAVIQSADKVVLALAGLGDTTSELRIYDAAGKELSRTGLDAVPLFDGLAAANGDLYVSTQTGSLLCFGE